MSMKIFKRTTPRPLTCWALYPGGGRCTLEYPHLEQVHVDSVGNEWAFPGDVRAGNTDALSYEETA